MTQRDQLAENGVMCKILYLLSTAYDDLMDVTLKAKGFHEQIKPNTVGNYNTYKVGVDKSDQILCYYVFK
jgi:hypothetical protein